MRLQSAVLAALVTTLCVNCYIAESNAATTMSDRPRAIQSPDEAHHEGKRSIRMPVAAGGESKREASGLDWFASSAAKALKAQKAKWIKSEGIYDDLIGGTRTTWEVYGAWKKLDASPEYIAKAMNKGWLR
ncbi:hypothetical protein PHYSODRAFT_468685 [Phytophthora sojae]|uniref:RxLR effector protein n=1 Tax=Phytophthora sojae (strain P6497) TaxID=1094619 RepID=G4YEN9_PHYSP|nr:hypothetical protein PHYSODRAFT_468685 [Phytophthora sojae]EGZ26883.1 hypothetical protein PHYSODRAFT_468685 [Phytophthora sojae]|eukprot:XP_009514158.1 hypothetical protein PHYSODRAFT_468685 [Phytophthora sojae]